MKFRLLVEMVISLLLALSQDETTSSFHLSSKEIDTDNILTSRQTFSYNHSSPPSLSPIPETTSSPCFPLSTSSSPKENKVEETLIETILNSLKTFVSIRITSQTILQFVRSSETSFFAAMNYLMSQSDLPNNEFMMKYWLPFGNFLWKPSSSSITLTNELLREELENRLLRWKYKKGNSLRSFISTLEKHLVLLWVTLYNPSCCGDLFLVLSSLAKLLRHCNSTYRGSNLTRIYATLSSFLLRKLLIPTPVVQDKILQAQSSTVFSSDSFANSFILVYLLTKISDEFDYYWKKSGSSNLLYSFMNAWSREETFWPEYVKQCIPEPGNLEEHLTNWDSSKVIPAKLYRFMDFFTSTWNTVSSTKLIPREELQTIVKNQLIRFDKLQLFAFLVSTGENEDDPFHAFPCERMEACVKDGFQVDGHLEVANLSFGHDSMIRAVIKRLMYSLTVEEVKRCFQCTTLVYIIPEVYEDKAYTLLEELLYIMQIHRGDRISWKIYWLYCYLVAHL